MSLNPIQKKIDFVALAGVMLANPNGGPEDEGRPRQDDGYGYISDKCIKRKIRNRMQDMGYEIFIQTDERSADGCTSLKERADKFMPSEGNYPDAACEKWIDVRTFGQVFAFSKEEESSETDETGQKNKKQAKKGSGVSIGIRGPVTIQDACSIDPVDVMSMQITKSVNGNPSEKTGKDRMGWQYRVKFGVYKIVGSINVRCAEKTGFSEEDANVVKEALKTLFVNDASAARPEGSMWIEKLYWFKHNNKIGQYPARKVFESVTLNLKDGVGRPRSMDDYEINFNCPDGLECEVIDGI